MDPRNEVELIEKLLKALPKHFDNSHDLLLYQRGYLTGLLASIAHNDSAVKVILQERLNHLHGTGRRD